jgi:hypothetical protein
MPVGRRSLESTRQSHCPLEEAIMFVQVIEGRVQDAAALRAAIDDWFKQVSPGATGWLGSTGGVTDDGRAIALVRFESEQAARANSDRPEQDEWWAHASKLFDGEPTFSESSDIDLDIVGDPGRAGFVQVMKGRGSDPKRARELMAQDSEAWAAFRPDILGSLGIGHPGGAYTMAIYFTSEAAAREGETKEMPENLKAQMEEMGSLMIGEPEFFDLKDPWMHAPD